MRRWALFSAIALCALLLAGFAPTAAVAATDAPQAARTCDGDEGVYLYDGKNYTGRCIRLTADEPDLSDDAFNNIASSIRTVGDWTATLFVNQNYDGTASTFSDDDLDLSNNSVGDNSASSVRVARGDQPAEHRCDGSEGVYLYDETNYGGRCIRFTDDEPDLSDVAFNNTASSLRTVGDWTATLFVDQNYSGASSTFTSDDSDLSNNNIGNNRASSIRVQHGDVPSGAGCDGGEGLYLYEHPNYQGRCVKFTGDEDDLRTVAFDDTTSSLRILGSWTATLYRDLSGAGASSTFTQDDANLADNTIGDNQATSVRLQRGGSVPSANACDGGEGAYLYEHPNYQGRCVKLTGDTPDLRTVGFDDTTSSLRILGSWTVTLYRDLSGTGASSTFTQDDSNLADNTIGDNQATSASVRRGGGASGNSCDGGDGVYLYEHPNYQGRCIKLTGDVGDLRTVGFDDTTSSLRVLGNWTVVLFRDLYGTGISSTFTRDDSNVADDGIGDNQATSASVRRR